MRGTNKISRAIERTATTDIPNLRATSEQVYTLNIYMSEIGGNYNVPILHNYLY